MPTEDGPERLEKIRAAARDRLGEVYIFDEKRKNVLRFNDSGEFLGAFPDNNKREILALEVDTRGNLVMLVKKDRSVHRRSPRPRG